MGAGASAGNETTRIGTEKRISEFDAESVRKTRQTQPEIPFKVVKTLNGAVKPCHEVWFT